MGRLPFYRRAALRAWRRTVRMCAVRNFIERGRRGWHREDLWAFDHHIARVIAGGLRELAEVSHGYPGDEEFPTFESWQAWLRDTADMLEAWLDPDAFIDREAFARTCAGMQRVVDKFGNYWD